MFVRIKKLIKTKIGHLKSIGKQKVFCIGRNKTGTTSLARAMSDLGYVIGNQRTAELLLRDWASRDFSRIAKYCKTAEFFQDIPFSLPYTMQAMDMYYPGSKFILTIRDSESWYKSMRDYHLLESVHGEKAESLEKLKEAPYCYKGFAYESKVLVYDLPGDDPYHKETLIEHYNYHNKMSMDYFHNRKNDLLILDVTQDDAYSKLCKFLDKSSSEKSFPWENSTTNITKTEKDDE